MLFWPASWRRIVGKAEWTHGEANPRFIVTSLRPGEIDARVLYERVYCARGEIENRIKECQLDLLAGRVRTCQNGAERQQILRIVSRSAQRHALLPLHYGPP